MKRIILFLLMVSVVLAAEPGYKSTKIWEEVTLGNNYLFVSNINIPVTEVSFDSARKYLDAATRIETISQPYGSIGIDYSYFEINNIGLEERYLSNIRLSFRVEMEWLDDNDVNKSSITLYSYDDGWKSHDTKIIGADSSFVYYSATVLYFGIFAISGQETVLVNPVTERPNYSNPRVIEEQEEKEITIVDNELFKNLFPAIIAFLAVSLVGVVGGAVIVKYHSSGFSNVEEAEMFAGERIAQGDSIEDIKKDLTEAGWNEKMVNLIVDEAVLPRDTETELRQFISTAMTRGKTVEQIKAHLASSGWQEKIIDRLIKQS